MENKREQSKEYTFNNQVVLHSIKCDYDDHIEFQVVNANKDKEFYRTSINKSKDNNSLDPQFEIDVQCFPWGFILTEINSVIPQNVSMHLNFNMMRKMRNDVYFYDYEGNQIAKPIKDLSLIQYIKFTSSDNKINKHLIANPITQDIMCQE